MKEPIGLKSLSGKDICEGDVVQIYALRHQVVEEVSTEGSPVFIIDMKQPLPVADVPLAKGVVYWSEEQLAWECSITWGGPGWENVAGIHMGGGAYAYEMEEN